LKSDREEYIGSLNRASGGDLQPLISLVKRLMESSLLDLLDAVGTDDDELLELKRISSEVPYSTKYLGLRCKQGEIPGVFFGNRCHTSKVGLNLYMDKKGKK
jgi:hypothetical protein